MYFKSLNSKKYFVIALIILSFIFLSYTSAFILLKNNVLYTGTDTQFHIKRIMELNNSFNKGIIFPDFSFNQFHGSGVMNLYPYISLFPIAILSIFIKSPIKLVYGLFILNTFFNFIISFYSSKKYTGKYLIAYIFSIIYSLSNIFLMHSLITMDLGIVYSYIFLPLVIFGIIQMIQHKNGWIELSIGISLILYSHILNLLIIGCFLSFLFILNIKKIDKQIMFNLFKSCILFLFLTSVIWIPFIHFYIWNNFNLPVSFQLNRISIKEFISGIYGSKSNNTIGFFPLIALFITPFFYKKINKYIKQMYSLSVFIVLGTLFLPWKLITSYGILKTLNHLQFTFRFLLVPQMLLSFIFAVIISKYVVTSLINKYMIYICVIFIAIFIQIITGQYTMIIKFSNNPLICNNKIKKDLIYINGSVHYKINNYRQFNLFVNNSYQSSNDDYIPKNAISISPYIEHNLGFYNNYNQIKVNHIGYNTFSFFGKDDINKLSLPIYVYNKEKLHVYLNNKPISNYANKDGLLTINNIQNEIRSNNSIYIRPYFDLFRIIGIILSIFGWLFVLVIFIKRKFTN